MSDQAGPEFHRQLLGILPRLRSYALSLTNDREFADELVQSTVVNALAQQAAFRPGSNMVAWLFRILRNAWIDTYRRRRPTDEINEDTTAALSASPSQETSLLKAEFLKAFATLRPHHREALVLSVIEGQSYEQIAAHAGVSVGTLKNRLSRAREKLLVLMTGETPHGPGQTTPKRRPATTEPSTDSAELPDA